MLGVAKLIRKYLDMNGKQAKLMAVNPSIDMEELYSQNG